MRDIEASFSIAAGVAVGGRCEGLAQSSVRRVSTKSRLRINTAARSNNVIVMSTKNDL
jgi:hypothetical protein